jgi:hypothetical protein
MMSMTRNRNRTTEQICLAVTLLASNQEALGSNLGR